MFRPSGSIVLELKKLPWPIQGIAIDPTYTSRVIVPVACLNILCFNVRQKFITPTQVIEKLLFCETGDLPFSS